MPTINGPRDKLLLSVIENKACHLASSPSKSARRITIPHILGKHHKSVQKWQQGRNQKLWMRKPRQPYEGMRDARKTRMARIVRLDRENMRWICSQRSEPRIPDVSVMIPMRGWHMERCSGQEHRRRNLVTDIHGQLDGTCHRTTRTMQPSTWTCSSVSPKSPHSAAGSKKMAHQMPLSSKAVGIIYHTRTSPADISHSTHYSTSTTNLIVRYR